MNDPVQRHPTRTEQLDILASVITDICTQSDKVLDLGCGTGYVAGLLLDRVQNIDYYGVDINTDSLKQAAVHLHGRCVTQLAQADLMRVDELPFGSERFKVIFSALVFHDLGDEAKQQLIRWCASHLANDGYFLLYDRVRLSQSSTFALQRSVWSRIERVHGVAMRSAPTYETYLADLGSDNRPATLDEYSKWFRAAGLDSQILHLHGNVALIGAAISGQI